MTVKEEKTVGSLKSRVFAGVSWLAFAQVLVQVFSFVITAILARLLSPNDFGLMGVAIIVLSFLNTINNFGISVAIIQKKELNADILSSVFWPNIGIGFLLFGLAVLLSGNIAIFFGAPESQAIIVVLSLSLIFLAFGRIQAGILRRELEFKKVALRRILETLAYGIVSVTTAFLGFGVWSLVIGNLAKSFVGSVTFWFAVKWRPSLTFNIKYFKEVYGFGLKVLLSGIVNFFRDNSDYVLIGKFLGTRNLGIYTIAYNIGTLARSKITALVGSTLTPAYSKIQSDHKRIQKASSEAAQYLALIVFPASFGLLAVAPEFIKVVYGQKWIEAILPLQILLIGGSLLAINPVLERILTAIGRPGTSAIWSIIRTSFLMAAIYIGLRAGGIVGVALGVTLTVLLSTPISHLISFHFIGGNVWLLWRELGILASASIAMALGVFWIKGILANVVSTQILLLGLEVAFGVVLYALLIAIIKPPAWGGVWNLASPALAEIRVKLTKRASLKKR